MANMKKLKAIIDWIYEKDPENGIGEIATKHDMIYLSIPNGVTGGELEEKGKGKELGFSIEYNSIRIFT